MRLVAAGWQSERGGQMKYGYERVEQRGMTAWQKLVLQAIAVAMLIIGVIGWVLMNGIAPNYSNGERSGVVTKISKKGLIFKSWEAEMLIALPADSGTVVPEKFAFNVDPSAVQAVQKAAASGKRVALTYRQWLLSPIRIDHDHVALAVTGRE